MIQLKYNVYLSSHRFGVTHISAAVADPVDSSTNPMIRVYLHGTLPPAYTAGFSKVVSAEGIYDVDFKSDIVAETKLGVFRVPAIVDMCDGETSSLWGISRSANLLTVFNTTSDLYFVSIDGGATFKPANNVVGSGVGTWGASFTDAELSALGYTTTIPEIRTRKIACQQVQGENVFIGTAVYDPLVADYAASNPTSNGATDGSIVVSISGGSGQYSYAWADGPTTKNRSGLSAGTYSLLITDLITGDTVTLEVTLTEPVPVVKPGTFIRFPQLNSLRWVVREAPVDGCTIMQTLDNTLFCEEERFNNQVRAGYDTLVQYCDRPVVQWESDFPDFLVELRDRDTSEVVRSFSSSLKENNLNTYEDFDVLIRPNPDAAGTCRVYFTSLGAFPIPVKVGDTITLLNNLDGMNGDFVITNILIDLTGAYYMVINLVFSGATQSSATGRFYPDTVDFNVFESVIVFDALPEGRYYVTITCIQVDASLAPIESLTEPIRLAVKHRMSQVIEYRNVDNFSITWTTGYVGRVRIIGKLVGQPTAQLSTSRNANSNNVVINGKPIRGFILMYESLPRWLHEKLTLIFACDTKTINGQSVTNTEAPGEVQYSKDELGNNSVKVEFDNEAWIGRYNSDDIGTVSDGGFIEQIDGGFIQQIP